MILIGLQELIKAWGSIDADYDLRAARDSFSTDPRAPRPDGGQVVRGITAAQLGAWASSDF